MGKTGNGTMDSTSAPLGRKEISGLPRPQTAGPDSCSQKRKAKVADQALDHGSINAKLLLGLSQNASQCVSPLSTRPPGSETWPG